MTMVSEFTKLSKTRSIVQIEYVDGQNQQDVG